MARPDGPKKVAAKTQLAELRAQGLPDLEIRQILIESGLTQAQALELVPRAPGELPAAPAKPVLDAEEKAAVVNGAIHFLETVAKRLKPDVVDRYPDLGSVKGDALTWSRKLKGAL